MSAKGKAAGKIIRIALQQLRKVRVRGPNRNLPTATVRVQYKSFMPRKQFERKMRALVRLSDQGKLFKATNPVQRNSQLTRDYKNQVIQRIHRMYSQRDPAGTRALIDRVRRMDVDHIHDLQLGGPDVRSNLRLLDRATNTDIGLRQIWPQIRGLPDGTPIRIQVVH